NESRPHAELRVNGLLVSHLSAATVHLDYTIVHNTLGKILVRRPNTNLIDALIIGSDISGRGECVVRLELDHRPNDDTHCRQKLFERHKLGIQCALYSGTGLITWPQSIPKGFNDMVRRDTNMSGTILDHFGDHMKHTRHCAKRRVALLKPPD